MRSIEWNEKGQTMIPPMERDRFERGEPAKRLDGTLTAEMDGRVWFASGEHRKLVGSWMPQSASAPAERDLDAPAAMPARSRKTVKKVASKRKAK